ncbi:hypothetical protein HY490_05305 [Candidatus Woesearchaeota archaeon]|nr:hypothetical protein [Candidatus Woesearchaeota archaeon]
MVVRKLLLLGLFSVFFYTTLLQSYIFWGITQEITAMVTQGQVSVSIDFVERGPPIVTILLPPDASTFSQNDAISLQVRALDDDAVQSVTANATLPNGTIIQITLTDSNNDGVFETTFSQTSAGGTYTLRAIATDVHSNVNSNQTVQFTITAAVTPPTPPPAAGAGGGGSAATSVGPKMAVVAPTQEKPSPGKRVSRKGLATGIKSPLTTEAASSESAAALQFVLSLPSLVTENINLVNSVIGLSVINALIALYLVSLALIRILTEVWSAHKTVKHVHVK